jgi:hypothetical protein
MSTEITESEIKIGFSFLIPRLLLSGGTPLLAAQSPDTGAYTVFISVNA